MTLTPHHKGFIAASLTVLIWASFIVIARASASHTLLPLDIVFLRIAGAAVVLMPWSLWMSRQSNAKGSLGGLSPLPLRLTVQAGLFGGLLFAVLCYSGFFFAPASHASVLLPGSLPLWTTLLAWWVLSEPLSRWRIAGLFCILTGDLLVGGSSLLMAFQGGDVWKGDLLIVSSAICWAAYSVLVRKHHIHPVKATMGVTAFALVTFVPLYGAAATTGLVASRLHVAPWSELLFQATFQGVGSVVVSGIMFNVMIQHYGPVRSTMITALVPGLSAIGAAVLLGESLGPAIVLGLALVTGGILLGVKKLAAPPQAPSSNNEPTIDKASTSAPGAAATQGAQQ